MATTPSKDTTPSGNRTQRYRVDGRAFLNGTTVQPSDNPERPRYEYGPPGQHGKHLVAVDESGSPLPVPERARPMATGTGSEADALRRQLDAAFAEIEHLKQLVSALAPAAKPASGKVAPASAEK